MSVNWCERLWLDVSPMLMQANIWLNLRSVTMAPPNLLPAVNGVSSSVQIGWRISEESFLKNIEWVNNLKIRASYGKMGDDSCADYQFITGFDYPNTSGNIYNNYPKGYVFDGQVVNALGFRSAANPNLTWYTIKTANVGVDADFGTVCLA